MIKIINNLTTTQKIEVKSKIVKNNKVISNILNTTTEGKNDQEIFVQLTFKGIYAADKLGDCKFDLYITAYAAATFKVIACNTTDFSDNKVKSLVGVSGNEVIQSYAVCRGSNYKPGPNTVAEIVRLDLTKLVKQKLEDGETTVIFKIINDSTTEFTTHHPEDQAKSRSVCTANFTEIDGMNEMYEYAQQHVGDAGVGSLNLATGNLIFTYEGLKSDNKKLPISFNAYYNNFSKKENFLLGKGFRTGFEYAFDIKDRLITQTDPTGKKGYYQRISDEIAKELAINPEIESGDIYYNGYDASYLFKNKNSITCYDKNKNKMEFLMVNNLARPVQITTASKGYIKFSKDKAREVVSNNDAEKLYLDYDTNGKITKATFHYNKKYISFIYNADNRLKEARIYRYSLTNMSIISANSDKMISHVEFIYDQEGNLLEAIDHFKNYGYKYEYLTNGKVAKLGEFVLNPKSYGVSTSFDYKAGMTIMRDYTNESMFLYFDNYGRCKIKLDQEGKSISYIYAAKANEISKNLLGESNVQINERNLIQNHSFDSQDFLFEAQTTGWKLSKGQESIVKVLDGGVYGEKCLSMDKKVHEQILISQKIINPISGTQVLEGFLKYQAKELNQMITQGEIEIGLKGHYQASISVPSTGRVSGNQTNDSVVSIKTFEYNYNLNQFTGEQDWKKFTIKADIPHNAINHEQTLEIKLSGKASLVFLDDFQLSYGDHKVRYNYVENGYFEAEINNRPIGFEIKGAQTEQDGLVDVGIAEEHSTILGKKVMKFSGNKSLKTREIERTIKMAGKSQEELIFTVLGKGYASLNDKWYSYVKFNYNNKTTDTCKFDFDKNFNNWQVLTHGIVPKYDYYEVVIGVSYSGLNPVYVDAFQLYKDSMGSQYTYDKKSNLIEKMNESGDTSIIGYDEENNVQEVTDETGDTYRYEYNHKKQLTDIFDSQGNQVHFTLDDKGNKEVSKFIPVEGKEVVTSQTLDKYGNPTVLVDERGQKITRRYDSRGNVEDEVQPNGLKKTQVYNEYNELLETLSILGNDKVKNTYVYNQAGNIKDITCENGTAYHFNYNSWGKVESIQINNTTYVSYKYDDIQHGVNTWNITEQKYGNSSMKFNFDYDVKGRLRTVQLMNRLLVSYKYDELNRVTEIKDENTGKLQYISYDSKGRIVKKSFNNHDTIAYDYDNLDSVQKATYQINDLVKSYDYEYKYEINDYSLNGYISRLDKAFNDDMIKVSPTAKGMFGAVAKMNTTRCEFDKALAMQTMNFTSGLAYLEYDLSSINSSRTSTYTNTGFWYDNWKSKFANEKTVYTWIRPENISQASLFSFTSNNSEILSLKTLSSGQLQFNIGAVEQGKTTKSLVLKQWNFIALQLSNNQGRTTAKMVLNDEVVLIGSNFGIDISMLDKIILNKRTGLQGRSSTSILPLSTFNFKLCMISIGAFTHTNETLKGIYENGKYYLNKNKTIASSGVSYYNPEVYRNFDVITLNGSLNSTNGVKPLKIVETDFSYKVDKAKIFKFDYDEEGIAENLEKHVFGSYNTYSALNLGNIPELKYDLNLRQTGTLSTRFKVMNASEESRYLFANQKEGIIKLGVFINHANQLMLDYNDTKIPALKSNGELIQVEMKKWHFIAVSWNASTLKLQFNKEVYSISQGTDSTGCITSIGCSHVNNTPVNHLQGNMEMFIFSKEYIQKAELDAIIDNGQTIISRTKYDITGRTSSLETIIGKKKFVTNYTFETVMENQTSTKVSKEQQANGNQISYEYDSMGNMTLRHEVDKTNQLVSKEIYEYDGLNRLIKSINDTNAATIATIKIYIYDTNNNIKKIEYFNKNQAKEKYEIYSYNTWMPDRLEKVETFDKNNQLIESKPIYYHPDFIQLPIQIEGKTLQWEGKRLKTVNNSQYFYNADGQRFKKVTPSYIEEIFVEGSSIIQLIRKQTNGKTYKLFFNYNETGSLIGFTMGSKEYFYNRDLMGNILKIVDKNGEDMVKYSYNEWGLPSIYPTSLEDATLIAQINPFLYKGYIFDQDTNWYYLKTRYYSPQMKRFINADGEIGTVGDSMGMNLYAYCLNNPINYADENGNWPSWATKVIIGVGVIAVLGAVTLATGGFGAAGCCIVKSMFFGAVKGAAIGTIQGALTGAVLGGVLGGITTGSWEGALKGVISGAIDGAADGFMFGAIGGAISGAMNSKYCFTAGTLVLTKQGLQAIETIQKGDKAYSIEPDTGLEHYKEITQVYENETTELYHITLNNEVIHTTKGHPFLIKDKGWINASELVIGDLVQSKDNVYYKIEEIQREELAEKVKTYNLEVEGYHVYVVGKSMLVVHNACEDHHTVSNKNQKSIDNFNSATNDNGIIADLNGSWNLNSIAGHRGRHTNVYHGKVNDVVKAAASANKGNLKGFTHAMEVFGRKLKGEMMQIVGKDNMIELADDFISLLVKAV